VRDNKRENDEEAIRENRISGEREREKERKNESEQTFER
jgi:hypothetical protein